MIGYTVRRKVLAPRPFTHKLPNFGHELLHNRKVNCDEKYTII